MTLSVRHFDRLERRLFAVDVLVEKTVQQHPGATFNPTIQSISVTCYRLVRPLILCFENESTGGRSLAIGSAIPLDKVSGSTFHRP